MRRITAGFAVPSCSHLHAVAPLLCSLRMARHDTLRCSRKAAPGKTTIASQAKKPSSTSVQSSAKQYVAVKLVTSAKKARLRSGSKGKCRTSKAAMKPQQRKEKLTKPPVKKDDCTATTRTAAAPVLLSPELLSPELRNRVLFEDSKVLWNRTRSIHVVANVEVKVPLPPLPTKVVEAPPTSTKQPTTSSGEESPAAALTAASADLPATAVPSKSTHEEEAPYVIQKAVQPLCDIYLSPLPRASPTLELRPRCLMTPVDNRRQWGLDAIGSAQPDFATMCFVIAGANTEANAKLHSAANPPPEKKKKQSSKSGSKAALSKINSRRLRSFYTQPPPPGAVHVIILDQDER